MVVARNGVCGKLGEGGRDRVPHFGLELGGGIGEGLAEDLASSNENLASWQNHGVGEDTLIPHGVDVLDDGIGVRAVDLDNMGIGCRIDTLIVGSTTNHKNFALGSIIHDRITAHGITVVASDTCALLVLPAPAVPYQFMVLLGPAWKT